MSCEGGHIIFKKGIIESFKPSFKSISKDKDRYFDAVFQLSEDGVIETSEILKLSNSGYLWITSQYIERGYLELVEADVIKSVTHRDLYGPLHANTKITIKALLQLSKCDTVQGIYRAAIEHRLRHLQNTSNKRRRFFLPACKKLIKTYQVMLTSVGLTDPDLQKYAATLKEIQTLKI